MLKQIGNTEIKLKHKASCHCGAVELELDLPNGVVSPMRCDCSICSKKGIIASPVLLSELKVIKGQEVLSLYQFNTKVAKHYFCSDNNRSEEHTSELSH